MLINNKGKDMSDDFDYNPKYDDNKKEKTIYVSKRQEYKDTFSPRVSRVRYADEVFPNNTMCGYLKEKDGFTLRVCESGKQKIKVKIFETINEPKVAVLHIYRVNENTGNPFQNWQACFWADEIDELYNFLTNVKRIDYSNPEKFKVSNEIIEPIPSNEKIRKLMEIIPTEQLTDSILDLYKKLPNNHDKVSLIEKLQLDIPDLYNSYTLKQRKSILEELKNRLNNMDNYHEDKGNGNWQDWFKNKQWIFGSDVVQILDKRRTDYNNIYDYIIKSYDGFVDLIEIKDPKISFWAQSKDHNNYIPSVDLTRAITQCANYIHCLEKRINDKDIATEIGNILKPRCTLVVGRSNTWNAEQFEAFRILNSMYHNISIITYDMLLKRAQKLCSLDNTETITENKDDIFDEDCPF